MVKKNPENKFKKLILTWWIWIIVAVASYLLMILMPFDWDKGIWEGSNIYGTFFAYLTQISWIVVVSLLIFAGIKKIQKSKIDDIWKTSLTIIGILGIIAYVIYSLFSIGIFNNLTYEHDERIGDLENEDKIRIHINLLEEDGYEVLYFGYLDVLNDTATHSAYLKMKSLGSKNEQVWSGLHSLTAIYPNAPRYSIRILEPTQECWYDFDGKLLKGYYGTEDYTLDGENVTSLEFYSAINYIIENPNCS
jgi:hypothetical protein